CWAWSLHRREPRVRRVDMLIVHASDVHLDSPLRGLPEYPESPPLEAFRLATRRALTELVTLCIREQASLLLLAGDLVDASGRDHKTGLFFVEEMLRLREAGIPVFSIRGNHDAASRVIQSLLLPDNVKEFSLAHAETVTLDSLGVAVHGRSYEEREALESFLPGYPPPVPGLLNFGVLHTSAEGRVGHDPYAPCTRRALRNHGYDYFALGHVHTREVLSETPWVVFSGNLQGRSIRESGPKGATLVTIDGGRVARVEHRALDVVRFGACRVGVADARTLDEIAERSHRELTLRARAAGARALAVRLLLQGEGGIGELLSHPAAHRIAALRRAVAEVRGASIWLEGIWGELHRELGGAMPLGGQTEDCEPV
ncbi:MAG TPA: DNA repair exonuclease, partial [Polyangiaceae bacterium]